MKTIKTKILLNIFLCVLLASSVIGILASYMNFRSTVQTLQQALVESAGLAAREVSNKLDGYQMLAEELSQHSVLTGNAAIETKRGELALLQDSPHYLSLEILDQNGIALSNGADYSSQDTFTYARDKDSSFVTDPVVQGDSSSIYLSYPIKKDGVFKGAVVMTLDGKILSDIVSQIKLGDGGSAYIVAKNGTTIGSPFYDSVLKKQNTQKDALSDPSIKTLADIEAAMCRGESGFGSYSYQGTPKLAAYCPIEGTTWSIDVAVTRSDFMDATNRSLLVTLLMIAVMSILSYLVAHYCARVIATPIIECSNRLRLLADGDFQSPVPVFTNKDETGSLADSTAALVEELKQVVFDISSTLNEMASGNFALDFNHEYRGDFKSIQESMSTILDSMNETLYHIDLTAEQVSSGSSQVSYGAQGLSAGTTQQASAVEELSASVQAIANEVQNNADNARRTNEKANSVGTLLVESNQSMSELTNAMDEIRSTAGQIGKIIKTIEDIAFQTNILALNAAVEAARAGAAGKGFAVVAGEVRNLASKSAEASKNTSALIDNSLKAVERGASMTDATANSLSQVVAGAQEIIETVELISKASSQQAEAISQISTGVDQITNVVHTNSATAEESAAASEQLSGQATTLKDMVNRFKLRHGR